MVLGGDWRGANGGKPERRGRRAGIFRAEVDRCCYSGDGFRNPGRRKHQLGRRTGIVRVTRPALGGGKRAASLGLFWGCAPRYGRQVIAVRCCRCQSGGQLRRSARAPTFCACAWPPLYRMTVGMPRMPYLPGVDGLASISSLATRDLAAVLLCHLVKTGANIFARTAPFGPEVDQDRVARLQHVLVEGCVGNVFDCSAHENPLLGNAPAARGASFGSNGSRSAHLVQVCLMHRRVGADLLKFKHSRALPPDVTTLVKTETESHETDHETERPMTYVVTESCIRCKYTDCVDVCPVDCFREGPTSWSSTPTSASIARCASPNARSRRFLPRMTCRPTNSSSTALNAELSKLWKPIIERKPGPRDADEWKDVKDKLKYLER